MVEQQKAEKLADLNRSVRGYLNIPKPILEYVVFCHQEDSLWPFDDSKKLKEKFDEIFQSTEYVKVLTQLKKERKEQQELFRSTKKDAERFLIYVKQKQETEADVQKIELELGKLKTSRDKSVELLEPHRKRIQELEQTHTDFARTHQSYNAARERIRELKRDIAQITSKSGKDFQKFLTIILKFWLI